MTDDPFKDPWFLDFEKRVRKDLVPKLSSSAMTISLNPSTGEADVKFAVELGFSIMLNKPIIVVAQPGDEVPPGLARVAHRVLYIDISAPEASDQINEAMTSLAKEFNIDIKDPDE